MRDGGSGAVREAIENFDARRLHSSGCLTAADPTPLADFVGCDGGCVKRRLSVSWRLALLDANALEFVSIDKLDCRYWITFGCLRVQRMLS